MVLQPFGTFLAESEVEEPCLVEPGVLPFGGKAIIYGPIKAGKSLLVSQLGFDIANGLPWMGVWQTVPGTVVYVQCELPRGRFRSRMRSMYTAYPETPPDSYYLLTTLTMRATAQDSEFQSLLRSLKELRPTLTILDPQYKLLREGADENSARDMTILYNRLDAIIEDIGCAIMLVAHPRKVRFDEEGAVIEGGAQDLSGTQRQGAWADTVLHLKPKAGGKAQLVVEAMRYAAYPEPIQLSPIDDVTLRRMAEGGRGKADDDLLAALAAGPILRTDVLVQLGTQGYSESTIKRSLTRLAEERVIEVYDSPTNRTMKLVKRL